MRIRYAGTPDSEGSEGILSAAIWARRNCVGFVTGEMDE